MSGQIFEISSSGASASHAHHDSMDVAFSKRGCCYWIPFASSSRGLSKSSTMTTYQEPWWRRGWKKVREWSEKMAGPKWKTFVRRFGRNRGNNRLGGLGAGTWSGQFRYDPLSYAMNFDEGYGDDDLDGIGEETIMHGRGLSFSSRYASIPVCNKGSMDMEGDGRPIFT
ncbi:hypothetical protein SAY86_004228 [Trapa natans]|uniref:Uncharacterized protein n=1 Tax=Trapa natans TaxID=22666 RepID=A0AAN7N3P4_TRANT|nr:hypothetical protein SAY86_004228 [Trapa natans]